MTTLEIMGLCAIGLLSGTSLMVSTILIKYKVEIKLTRTKWQS
jgi:hypothetical protein